MLFALFTFWVRIKVRRFVLVTGHWSLVAGQRLLVRQGLGYLVFRAMAASLPMQNAKWQMQNGGAGAAGGRGKTRSLCAGTHPHPGLLPAGEGEKGVVPLYKGGLAGVRGREMRKEQGLRRGGNSFRDFVAARAGILLRGQSRTDYAAPPPVGSLFALVWHNVEQLTAVVSVKPPHGIEGVVAVSGKSLPDRLNGLRRDVLADRMSCRPL